MSDTVYNHLHHLRRTLVRFTPAQLLAAMDLADKLVASAKKARGANAATKGALGTLAQWLYGCVVFEVGRRAGRAEPLPDIATTGLPSWGKHLRVCVDGVRELLDDKTAQT